MKLHYKLAALLGLMCTAYGASRERERPETPVAHAPGSPADNLGFQVPEGFEVTLYADDKLATDIHSLTIDSKGRVVVAGPGYIKILHDKKGTGKADEATLFAAFPTNPRSGAQGMCFDGDDLICTGDSGVRRLYDTKGVGRCDKISPPFFSTKGDGEHSVHAIIKGPDGWFYIVAGNSAGIRWGVPVADAPGSPLSPGSPVKEPQFGTIVRFSPDGKQKEIVAHGFRNPYDFAFTQFGQILTVDSDGERVHHLPYYAPTRLFDVAQGMHHGWMFPASDNSWSRPAAWADNVERLVEIGRGSPTGAIVYRHRAFPEKYRNGFFSLCWTFGRLYFFPLTPSGSTYASKMEVFMKTTGEVGFAPTDMAVGPDGDLFVAIGGRGTRGGVFRIHHKGRAELREQPDPLRAVLAADEPLSSWSRAHWVPRAKKLGKDAFIAALFNAKLPLEERIRAVEVLTELFGGVPVESARKLAGHTLDPGMVAARAIWSLSRTTDSEEARKLMVEMTTIYSIDPIRRTAWEALAALPTSLDPKAPLKWRDSIISVDRRVRAAAILAAKGRGNASFRKTYPNLKSAQSEEERIAYLWVKGVPGPKDPALHDYLETCRDAIVMNGDMRLEGVRLLQIALGDVDLRDNSEKAFWGYVARSPANIDAKDRQALADTLAMSFPIFQQDIIALDDELARLIGMLEPKTAPKGLLKKLADRSSRGSSAEQDVHYLFVMARLPGERSGDVTKMTASVLNNIHIKLAKRGAVPSDLVPGILEALLGRLLRLDPALAKALVDDADFGVPGHALWANQLTGPIQQTAVRKLLSHIKRLDEDDAREAWTIDLVRLVANLPEEESLPVLRAKFSNPRLQDPIAGILAKKGRPEDRPRFVEALGSTQPVVIGEVAKALMITKQPGDKATPADIRMLLRAWRTTEAEKEDSEIRQTLVSLFRDWTGWKLTPASKTETILGLFKNAYPNPKEWPPESAGWGPLKKRLDNITWDGGDAKKGSLIYDSKNCFRCHSDARRLGPDLTGIAERLSRDDLFIAIFDPSKDVAPPYKATSVVTKKGKTHTGVVKYRSAEVILLQTTPDTTVRVESDDIDFIRPSSISFMPTGLLDGLTDDDLRNLYAYLKALRKK